MLVLATAAPVLVYLTSRAHFSCRRGIAISTSGEQVFLLSVMRCTWQGPPFRLARAFRSRQETPSEGEGACAQLLDEWVLLFHSHFYGRYDMSSAMDRMYVYMHRSCRAHTYMAMSQCHNYNNLNGTRVPAWNGFFELHANKGAGVGGWVGGGETLESRNAAGRGSRLRCGLWVWREGYTHAEPHQRKTACIRCFDIYYL